MSERRWHKRKTSQAASHTIPHLSFRMEMVHRNCQHDSVGKTLRIIIDFYASLLDSRPELEHRLFSPLSVDPAMPMSPTTTVVTTTTATTSPTTPGATTTTAAAVSAPACATGEDVARTIRSHTIRAMATAASMPDAAPTAAPAHEEIVAAHAPEVAPTTALATIPTSFEELRVCG